MYKSEILHFLNSFDHTLFDLLELGFYLLFGRRQHEIAHVQHLDRGHHVLVDFGLGLGPVDRDRLSEQLNTIGYELASCYGRCSMIRVLNECKTTILRLVMCARIDDHVDDVVGHFSHLFQDLLFRFRFRYAAHEQSTIVHAATNADHSTLPNLVVVQLDDRFFRIISMGEHGKAVASIVAAVLHHESKFVEWSDSFEQRHDLVLEAIARYFSDENLTAAIWLGHSWVPIGRRTELALAVLLSQWITGSFEQLLDCILIVHRLNHRRVQRRRRRR